MVEAAISTLRFPIVCATISVFSVMELSISTSIFDPVFALMSTSICGDDLTSTSIFPID